ncbi:MAG TPA: hypothetical protein VEH81_11950, partial [Ktedonobacteraceae bacterium]|nr:hypothetical protein [Ktedonobacteraceae bacterium]
MSEDITTKPSENTNASEGIQPQVSEATSSSGDVPAQSSEGVNEDAPANTPDETSTNEVIPGHSTESASPGEEAPVKPPEETSASEETPVKTFEDTSTSEVVPAKVSKETSTSEVVPAKPPVKTAKAGNRGLDITRRILVGVIMVLTLLGLILNVSELVAVWAAYGPTRNSVITVSNTLIQGLQVAEKGLARVEGYVTQARQTITDVNSSATQMGDHIKANSPLVTALSQRVETRLAPVMEKAQTTASTIHDVALKVNGALEALNRFPGVSVPTLNDQISAISNRTQQAESAVQDLRVSLADIKAGLVTKAETTVKQITARIDAPLARIQSTVNTYQAKVVNAQDRVT